MNETSSVSFVLISNLAPKNTNSLEDRKWWIIFQEIKVKKKNLVFSSCLASEEFIYRLKENIFSKIFCLVHDFVLFIYEYLDKQWDSGDNSNSFTFISFRLHSYSSKFRLIYIMQWIYQIKHSIETSFWYFSECELYYFNTCWNKFTSNLKNP